MSWSTPLRTAAANYFNLQACIRITFKVQHFTRSAIHKINIFNKSSYIAAYGLAISDKLYGHVIKFICIDLNILHLCHSEIGILIFNFDVFNDLKMGYPAGLNHIVE